METWQSPADLNQSWWRNEGTEIETGIETEIGTMEGRETETGRDLEGETGTETGTEIEIGTGGFVCIFHDKRGR